MRSLHLTTLQFEKTDTAHDQDEQTLTPYALFRATAYRKQSPLYALADTGAQIGELRLYYPEVSHPFFNHLRPGTLFGLLHTDEKDTHILLSLSVEFLVNLGMKPFDRYSFLYYQDPEQRSALIC